MATKAHCAFCFESLAANFNHQQPLGLTQVEDLWEQYHATKDDAQENDNEGSSDGDDDEVEGDDAEMTDADTDEASASSTLSPSQQQQPKPAAISRLLNSKSASSSSSSLPSTGSSASSSKTHTTDSSGAATPASSKTSLSSRSSLFSFGRRREQEDGKQHPLFVTWNTVSKSGYKSLRGCIGTFEPQELEYGLRSYALTSAFEDVRFQPIPSTQLSSLSCDVTLLTDFSQPTKDPLDWTLGKHGIRISFTHHGRRYGATYLPSVAREQGWTKEETLVSLMRKSGWNGSSSTWLKTWREGKGEVVRYEGKKVELEFVEWREWRDWVDKQGVESKPLN